MTRSVSGVRSLGCAVAVCAAAVVGLSVGHPGGALGWVVAANAATTTTSAATTVPSGGTTSTAVPGGDTTTTVPGGVTTTTGASTFDPTGPDFKVDYSFAGSQYTVSGVKCGGPGGRWTLTLTGAFSAGGIGFTQSGTLVLDLDATKSPPSGPITGQFHGSFTGVPGLEAGIDSSLTGTAALDASGLTFSGVSTGTVKVTGLPIAVPGLNSSVSSALGATTMTVASGVFCASSRASTTTIEASPSTTAPPPARGAQGAARPPAFALHTSAPGLPPGGRLVASGAGCDPTSAVRVDAGGGVVATAPADGQGRFAVALRNVQLPVGPHTLAVTCGTKTATIPISVVVQAAASPPGTSLLVVIGFVLLAPLVAYRLFVPGRRRRRRSR